jgi:hypothetical protein
VILHHDFKTNGFEKDFDFRVSGAGYHVLANNGITQFVSLIVNGKPVNVTYEEGK